MQLQKPVQWFTLTIVSDHMINSGMCKKTLLGLAGNILGKKNEVCT